VQIVFDESGGVQGFNADHNDMAITEKTALRLALVTAAARTRR
jgi:hypothetical protein